MALPTSVPETAADAFARVLSTATGVKSALNGVGALIARGGPVYATSLVGLYGTLNSAQGVGISIQGTPGLAAYAQTAMGDPNYDINAAFVDSIVACKQVTDWLLLNMPSDGSGGFLGWRQQADSTIQPVTIDPSALAPLASLITAALATFA